MSENKGEQCRHIKCESLTLHQTHINNPRIRIKALTLTTTPNGGCVTIYNRKEEAVVRVCVDDNGEGDINICPDIK